MNFRTRLLFPHGAATVPIRALSCAWIFDPNIAGTFVYHCHILDHEDAGMMAKIQVNPANDAVSPKSGTNASIAALRIMSGESRPGAEMKPQDFFWLNLALFEVTGKIAVDTIVDRLY